MRGSSRDSAVPLKRRSPFTGTAGSRVDSRISWRVPAVVVFLAVGPAVRASAAQCPDGSAPPCRSAVSAVAPVPNSVAVLYFDNLSADTADAYLAEGLTEELIARLGQLPRLAVKSRAAVRRFRQSGADPLAAARAPFASGLFLEWRWPAPTAPPDSLLARAVAAADRALALQPTSSDAWVARGQLLSVPDQCYRSPLREDAILQAFERAITLDPRSAEAYHQYGGRLLFRGEDAAAVAAFLHTLVLDPERPLTLTALALERVVARSYAEARRWLDSALTVDPTFAIGYAHRGMLALQLGDLAQARADGELAIRFAAGYRLPGLAVLTMVDARSGDTLAARARLQELLQAIVDSLHPSPRDARYVGPALLATAGENRLVEFLERVEPRRATLWFDLRLPEYDTIRPNPRFRRLVEESRPLGAPE